MSKSYSIFKKFKVLDIFDDNFKQNIKLLFVFGEINVILVTNKDEAYCYGNNKNGVLGLGHVNPVKDFIANKDLSNKQIVDFKSSDYYSIARTSDGKLYCWGKIQGHSSRAESIYLLKVYEPHFNEYLIDKKIIDFCCGTRHTIVLTSNNEVYITCDGLHHDIFTFIQLFFGWGVHLNFEIKNFNLEKVKSISCGSNHSMALTECGSVYSWGDNECGQLGRKTLTKVEKQSKHINIKVTIERISCGNSHSLLLSHEGDIYVFGSNKHRQLGLKTNEEKQFIPLKLNHSEKFTEIASHYSYDISAALSENGLYYVWGNCGEEGIISELKKTQFKSFDEIFSNYFRNTYKTVNRIEECLKNLSLLKDEKYEKNFIEIESISSGSFGSVFKVSNISNADELYAVKKIPLCKDQIEKWSKESKILEKMNSDYVVKCFDFWIETNYYLSSKFDYGIGSDVCEINSRTSNLCSNFSSDSKPLLLHIQMELCYKSLEQIIEILNEELKQNKSKIMGPLGYYISSELFEELVQCLHYLHEKIPPIIHRDLKPENILISYGTDRRFVKLADFGLAVIHETPDQPHTQGCGTDRYMAPEVRESRYYDTKADIYSLGIIAQQLFNININKIIEEKSHLNSKYSNLFDVIAKMVSYQTNKRPDCSEILKRKKLWALSLTELMEINSIKIAQINSIKKSFHQFFIQTKLRNSDRV